MRLEPGEVKIWSAPGPPERIVPVILGSSYHANTCSGQSTGWMFMIDCWALWVILCVHWFSGWCRGPVLPGADQQVSASHLNNVFDNVWTWHCMWCRKVIQYNNCTCRSIYWADGYVFVFSITDQNSYRTIQPLYQHVRRIHPSGNIPVILVSVCLSLNPSLCKMSGKHLGKAGPLSCFTQAFPPVSNRQQLLSINPNPCNLIYPVICCRLATRATSSEPDKCLQMKERH